MATMTLNLAISSISVPSENEETSRHGFTIEVNPGDTYPKSEEDFDKLTLEEKLEAVIIGRAASVAAEAVSEFLQKGGGESPDSVVHSEVVDASDWSKTTH